MTPCRREDRLPLPPRALAARPRRPHHDVALPAALAGSRRRGAAGVLHRGGARRRGGRVPEQPRRWRKWLSLRGLLTGQALTLPFFAHRDLRRAVDRWFEDSPPDLTYVYSSSMAQYVLRRRGTVKVMHFAELDSDKWLQFA